MASSFAIALSIAAAPLMEERPAPPSPRGGAGPPFPVFITHVLSLHAFGDHQVVVAGRKLLGAAQVLDLVAHDEQVGVVQHVPSLAQHAWPRAFPPGGTAPCTRRRPWSVISFAPAKTTPPRVPERGAAIKDGPSGHRRRRRAASLTAATREVVPVAQRSFRSGRSKRSPGRGTSEPRARSERAGRRVRQSRLTATGGQAWTVRGARWPPSRAAPGAPTPRRARAAAARRVPARPGGGHRRRRPVGCRIADRGQDR